jgi:hypothetical protein
MLVREKALARHPVMARWGEPLKGRVLTWGDLMFRESVVVVSTMLELMRDHDIPSLAIHDSLLVPQSAINTTATVLKARVRSVTQQEVQLTCKPKGLMVGLLGSWALRKLYEGDSVDRTIQSASHQRNRGIGCFRSTARNWPPAHLIRSAVKVAGEAHAPIQSRTPWIA